MVPAPGCSSFCSFWDLKGGAKRRAGKHRVSFPERAKRLSEEMASKPEGLEDRNKETKTIKKERKLMKNRKLYAAALAATLAVSMMGTTVMAYDGTTTFTYRPGTAGPTEPVDTTDPENDANNWVVSYPRNIVLMDNNEAGDDVSSAQTVGQKLTFKVTQRVAGRDNSNAVTAANIGNGIVVAPGGWTASTTDILMDASAGTSQVNMNLANSTSNAYLNPADTMMTLTVDTSEDDGFAVIKNGDAAKAVEGVTYTKAVTFSFTKAGA